MTMQKKDCDTLLSSLYEISKTHAPFDQETLLKIADDLDMRQSEVISIASFYSCFNRELKPETAAEIKPVRSGTARKMPLLHSAAKDISAYMETGGFESLKASVKDPAGILSAIQDAGVRGCGGAGFSVAKKWSAAKEVKAAEKYIVCNACEGEPDTFKDKVLLEECPFSIIEGILLCALAVKAEKGIICIRGCYDNAFETMSLALESARQQGFLDKNILGTDVCFDIELARETGAYVGGESTGLLEMLEGKRAVPRLKPPHAINAGYKQKPTVINNAETFAHIPVLVSEARTASCSSAFKEQPNTRLFTLLGCIEHPGVYEYPLGTTPKTMFLDAGGNIDNLIGLQIGGGASGSIVSKEALDLPLDFENCRANGITLGTGSIRFFDSIEDVMRSVNQSVSFMAEQSCGTCFSCREGLRQAQLILKRMQKKEGEEGDIDKLLSIIRCLDGNTRCGLGQSALVPLKSALLHFGSAFESQIWRYTINE